jgi:hypothetical protein
MAKVREEIMNKKVIIDIDAIFDDVVFDEAQIRRDTTALKIRDTMSIIAKRDDWKKQHKEAQEKRKDTGWNKKMLGNKNGAGKRKTKIVQPEHANIKRSEALKGIERHNLRGVPKPKVTCPHCGKEGGYPQMIQYHFDKCKHKK